MIKISIQDGRIVAKTPFELKETCKSIPGAKWDKIRRVWTYAASPYAAQEVVQAFGPYEVEDGQGQASVRDLARQIVRIKQILEHPETLDPIPKTIMSPRECQLQGYHLIKELPGVMLAFEMGVGKTKVVVDAVCNNLQEYRRVLVVCPKSVVAVWPKEFKKHAQTPPKVVALDSGSLKKRIKTLDHARIYSTGSIVAVINYEAVWQGEMGKYIKAIDWDMVVCDESHKIKSHDRSARASTFVSRLSAKKRVALTGTPMPHSPLDVWAQYRFLDPSVYGDRFTAFRARYAVMGGYQNHQVLGFQSMDDLNRRFYRIAIRVTKEEVLDLPDQVDTERMVTLAPKAAKAYRDMQNEFIAEVDGGVITASNALSKMLRLQQITSGFATNEEGEQVPVGDSKFVAFCETLDDIGMDQPVVTFCRFRSDLDRIVEAAEAAGRKGFELSGRKNELAEWQDDTTGSVLAVQIQAGGAGIDLTRSCYCVYYSLGLSLGDYMQSRSRLHRPGQNYNVTYVHLLASGTIDERIYRALQTRHEVVTAVLEMFHAASDQKMLESHALNDALDIFNA